MNNNYRSTPQTASQGLKCLAVILPRELEEVVAKLLVGGTAPAASIEVRPASRTTVHPEVVGAFPRTDRGRSPAAAPRSADGAAEPP